MNQITYEINPKLVKLVELLAQAAVVSTQLYVEWRDKRSIGVEAADQLDQSPSNTIQRPL